MSNLQPQSNVPAAETKAKEPAYLYRIVYTYLAKVGNVEVERTGESYTWSRAEATSKAWFDETTAWLVGEERRNGVVIVSATFLQYGAAAFE